MPLRPSFTLNHAEPRRGSRRRPCDETERDKPDDAHSGQLPDPVDARRCDVGGEDCGQRGDLYPLVARRAERADDADADAEADKSQNEDEADDSELTEHFEIQG